MTQMRYLATCPAGFQGVAAASLRIDLGEDLNIVHSEDGFLVFASRAAPGRVSVLPYLNNVFVSLRQDRGNEGQMIDGFTEQVIRATPAHQIQRATPACARTFRLMVSDAGRLVAINRKTRSAVNRLLSSATGLPYASGRADCEFWVFRRRSGPGFFSLRIGSRDRTEKDLQQGELRPELAHLLCALSEPQPTDVFMDPFAGTGALPFARARSPYNMIFAFDSDEGRVARLMTHLKAAVPAKVRKRSPIIIRHEDACALTSINEGFIDKIVTDPPWGVFDDRKSYSSAFYSAVARELIRVTKPDGLVVLLLGDEDEARRLCREFEADLACLDFLKVLVAGRKASVVKWLRRS